MLRVAVNGKFLAERMQGIVRYARELVCALDEVLDDDDHVELVIPSDAHDVPELGRIRTVAVGKRTGIAWEQLDYAHYLQRKRDLLPLNLCNVAPFLAPAGVTTIHDVMYRACPEFYTSPRNRISALWHRLQYRYVAARELAILTDSAYSRAEIERFYPRAVGKTHVVSCGWQHVRSIRESNDWRDRYPDLVPHEYLFSMATRARNKNGRWIYEVARRNPHLSFAVAGQAYETDDMATPANVQLLGFVSDEDACALIRNCRAFLFPSLYEGFGLPPLEALALGAEVVSSSATSLPEVLGDSVHYVDPKDYDIDLEELLAQPVSAAEDALGRLSWDSSARHVSNIMATTRTKGGRP